MQYKNLIFQSRLYSQPNRLEPYRLLLQLHSIKSNHSIKSTIKMTDAGRKDFTDKTKESLQPDSTKSTYDKVKEGVTDTTDKVTRGVVPDSEKSGSQSASDKLGRSKDQHTDNEGIVDKTKHALGMDKH